MVRLGREERTEGPGKDQTHAPVGLLKGLILLRVPQEVG